jgi:hypothetical protein
MHVAANFPVGIVTHHQRKLGVGLEVGQAVEHLHAGVFQAARPVNVGGFFETTFNSTTTVTSFFPAASSNACATGESLS